MADEVRKGGAGLAIIGFVLSLVALLAIGGGVYWVNGELKKINSGLEETKNSLEKSFDEHKTEIGNLNSRLDRTNEAINDFSNQLTATKGDIEKVASQYTNIEGAIKEFRTQLDSVKDDVNTDKSESQATRYIITNIQSDIGQLKDDVKMAVDKYDEINDKMAKLTEQIVLMESKMNELLGEFDDLKSAQSQLEEPTADDYFGQAEKYYSDRNWEAAIKYYNKAINLKDNWPVAYNNRGMAKFYNGDYEGAMIDLDKARKLDPTRADAVGKYIEKAKEKLAEEKK